MADDELWGQLNEESFFIPIPELRVPQSDITLLFLHRRVGYYEPIRDPWFQATRKLEVFGPEGPPPWPVYLSNRYLSVLACIEQYQFCNTTYCSPESGIWPKRPGYGLEVNDAQAVVLTLLRQVLSNTTISIGDFLFGDSFLLAKDSVWGEGPRVTSTTLPSDQWKREIAFFMSIILAAVQRMIVDYANPLDLPIPAANGSTTISSIAGIDLPQNRSAVEDALCRNIRIRSSKHLNFDAAALAAVVITALLLIITDLLCIPRLVFWARKKLYPGRADFARREWVMGHLYRVQARVWEVLGHGRFNAGKEGGI